MTEQEQKKKYVRMKIRSQILNNLITRERCLIICE